MTAAELSVEPAFHCTMFSQLAASRPTLRQGAQSSRMLDCNSALREKRALFYRHHPGHGTAAVSAAPLCPTNGLKVR